MDTKQIVALIEEWNNVTFRAIQFQKVSLTRIRKLLKETFELLVSYHQEPRVPKALCRLLLEMQDFGWWISDLEETPLHAYYQELNNLVWALNDYFFSGGDETAIENVIASVPNLAKKKGAAQ